MTMAASRSGLSVLPTDLMATSTTSPGAPSTKTSPTAATAEGTSEDNPAISSATARPTLAATMPARNTARRPSPPTL